MTGKNRNFFRNFKNAKNESDLCLEIAKFSDPTSYLPNIYKYKISDRLTYNMYRFESKKNDFAKSAQNRAIFKNLPL